MARGRGTTLPLRSHRNQPKCQESQCSRRETPAVSVQVELGAQVGKTKQTRVDRRGGALRPETGSPTNPGASCRSPPRLSGSVVINGTCFYSASFLFRVVAVRGRGT